MEKYKRQEVSPVEEENERDETYQASNPQIDSSRTHLNYNIILPTKSYMEIINERLSELNLKRKIRSDAILMNSFIITSDGEFFKGLLPWEINEFFRDCTKFFLNKYGEENMISAVVHMDETTPHMHLNNTSEGPKSSLQKTTMMVLAVVLHNIPEGMAVGVICAGWLSQSASISQAAALTLAIGIAIQNFPEGAIISMPLRSNGVSKGKALLYGLGSGIVEPIAGLITILLSSLVIPILPYLLSFAAGAMIYVVVEELIPEMSQGKHSNAATIFFMLGFSLMLFLDVTLG